MKLLLASVAEPATFPRIDALGLTDMSWDVATSSDGAAAIVGQDSLDVLVVAGNSPPPALVAFIKRMRQLNERLPILVFGSDDPAVRGACLDAGADDSVVSRCSAAELNARLHAVIRRSKGAPKSTVTVGNLCLDVNGASVHVLDRALELTRKEFRLLQMLVIGAGRSISKASLLDGLYPSNDDRDESIIGVFLCMIRKKLRAAGATVEIETLRGIGYCLHPQRVPLPSWSGRAHPAPATIVPHIVASITASCEYQPAAA